VIIKTQTTDSNEDPKRETSPEAQSVETADKEAHEVIDNRQKRKRLRFLSIQKAQLKHHGTEEKLAKFKVQSGSKQERIRGHGKNVTHASSTQYVGTQ